MTALSIGRSDYQRFVSKEARLTLRNRFFESNPVLNDTQVSLISRPTLRRWQEVGVGPIRAIFSEPGAFNSDVFVVSGVDLYRIAVDGTPTLLGTVGVDTVGSPTMAATGFIGDGDAAVPEYLFITDGGSLWIYAEDGFGFNSLGFSANAANNDTVTIEDVVYKFTTGDLEAGTPDGTVGAPWLVRLGVTQQDSMLLFRKAVNGSGEAGVDYSTDLVAHPLVGVMGGTVTTYLYFYGRNPNYDQTTINMTETGATLSFATATMDDSGGNVLVKIDVPTETGAISVAYVSSYVIVIPGQDPQFKGRFYWIEPGETTIDSLNYATAERSSDAINKVTVFGDKFWLTGETTTETWFPTGDPDAPMQRFVGVLFDRGCWEGTATQVKDSLILVDIDGAVFQIAGGLKRISRPDVAERIRLAIQAEATF